MIKNFVAVDLGSDPDTGLLKALQPGLSKRAVCVSEFKNLF